MDFRRVVLVCGHYGSGKTNISVNLAFFLRQIRNHVAIADLDIVNPYFRSCDSANELARSDIRLIASAYASSGLDLPALPQDIYSITEDKTLSCVVDLGGDDRGAPAIGRLREQLLAEDDHEMLYVVNAFRPLTCDPESAVEIMREIEAAAGMRCSAVVNNSNLGPETTAADVISSFRYADEICRLSGLPLKMTCAESVIAKQLYGIRDDVFPLKLQPGII